MKKGVRNQEPQQLPIIQDEKSNIQNISKGSVLEYRIKRLLFYMGYYAQTNILIKTSPEEPNTTITDLDVCRFSFAIDFSHSIKWVDCKSGTPTSCNILDG